MDYSTKEIAYCRLIEQVRNAYQTPPDNLRWCEDCEEINLWTYWHGRGNLDARIMLVGQDWGCPWDSAATMVMSNIRKMNSGESVPYMFGSESVIDQVSTDQVLIRLFQEIGYDLNTSNDKNKDLFFTNFVLGYRTNGISGGFQKDWAKHDAPYFRQLAEIIQPEIILCLGRDTFESVLMAFHYSLSPKIGAYNHFIESNRNPVTVRLQSQQVVRVFALAHCGKLGTLNRNRGTEYKTSLQLQINDWRKIKLAGST